jgi:putative redox protein
MGKARVKWIDGMNYVGTDADGRGMLLSGSSNGPGVSPMQALLLGLGSCASIDVVMILQKQRLNLQDVEVEIEGERGEDAPRPFKKIHMHFIVIGEALPEDKVQRAISLSTEKYCGAFGTLSASADITWDFEIQDTSATNDD